MVTSPHFWYIRSMEQDIENDANCFCCGTENASGLHLAFSYPDTGGAEAFLVIPEHFSGWKNMTHGGFLSMLLDEVMAHACISETGRTAVTAEMTVRFKKPVKTGSRVRITGSLTGIKGRILSTQGWVYDESGAVAAEGQARFLVSKPS